MALLLRHPKGYRWVHQGILLSIVNVDVLAVHASQVRDEGLVGTPLHCAARRGHTEVVRTLLSAGATVDIVQVLLSFSVAAVTCVASTAVTVTIVAAATTSTAAPCTTSLPMMT